MRFSPVAAVLLIALLLPPLPCEGSATEVACCEPEAGAGCNEEAASAPGGGGDLEISLLVGDETLVKLRLETPSAGQSADALREIAREAGQILKDWMQDNDDGEPHMKGKRDADSRRSP